MITEKQQKLISNITYTCAIVLILAVTTIYVALAIKTITGLF